MESRSPRAPKSQSFLVRYRRAYVNNFHKSYHKFINKMPSLKLTDFEF